MHVVSQTLALLFTIGKNGATNRAGPSPSQPVSADRASLEVNCQPQRRIARTRELGHCSLEFDDCHAGDQGIERDDVWLGNIRAGDVSFCRFALSILRGK